MTDIQVVILDLFKEISSLCEKRNITYYAIGGTCIGAVRHKGFIPWDDDLDIAIPIEQFDYFLTCVKTELPDYIQVYPNENANQFERVFFKIVDTRTTFIEDLRKNKVDLYSGVFVDVMPLSGIPTNEGARKRFCHKLTMLNWLHFAKCHPDSLTSVKRIIALSLKFFPYSFFKNIFYKEICKYPLSSSKKTGYVWSTNLGSLIFENEWFQEGIKLPFEDTTINCPVCYDKYLTKQFGNYMKLPPREKRVNGHPAFVDLKKTYRYYQKHPDKILI